MAIQEGTRVILVMKVESLNLEGSRAPCSNSVGHEHYRYRNMPFEGFRDGEALCDAGAKDWTTE